MSSLRPPKLLSVGLAVALAAMGSGLVAQDADEEPSPFQAIGSDSGSATPSSSPIDRFEFRGVMTVAGETYVTLVDSSNSKSMTIALGEATDGVRATDFRDDDGSIQIESGGQAKRLKLREAKIVALAVPPPQPPGGPPVQPGQRPGMGPNVAGAPMSDDEARARMQRVAEEIRRRREMRRQMLEAQRNGPGGTPQNR